MAMLSSVSHAQLDTLLKKQKRDDKNSVALNRSSSVSVGITPSKLNRVDQSRRVMYEYMPFTAMHGLQFKEQTLSRVLSHKSLSGLRGAETEEATLLGEVDVDEVLITAPLAVAVMIAVIAQFLVGYNTSLMNAPADVVFPGHSTAEWSLAVSAFAVGGPGGAILGGILANKLGRRGALLYDGGIFMIGGLLLTLAPNIYWLIPARFVIGVASGFATVLVPIYLGELAPPTLRGTLGTMTQFSMVIGILASDIFAYPLATPSGWRVLFSVTSVLTAIQLLCAPLLPESPRWLLARDEKSQEARIIMKKLRGFRDAREVEMEVHHLLFASKLAKTRHKSAHSASALLDLFADRRVRWLLISCLVLQVSQQLCGINAVFYYSTMFFEGLIDNPLTGTTLVAFVNVVATYVALKLMDTCGRRTLVLWSSAGMFFSCIVVTLSMMKLVPNVLALIAVMSFVFFFEIGLGPIPWLIVAEMFDQKYVATAMSVSSQVNWGCNFLVGIGFPFLREWLGVYSFVPFATVLLLTLFFTYFYLPETLGRTVQEIEHIVNGGNLADYGSAGSSGAGGGAAAAATTTTTAAPGGGSSGGDDDKEPHHHVIFSVEDSDLGIHV